MQIGLTGGTRSSHLERDDSAVHSRKPLRLVAFDYAAPRLYFVTICARRRGPVFGRVVVDGDGLPVVVLNALGRDLVAAVEELPAHRVTVVSSVVMPDHVHLILGLTETGPSLGVAVGGLKAGVSRRSRTVDLWQRGYFDRIVRDEEELERICAYIEANPGRWSASRGSEA